MSFTSEKGTITTPPKINIEPENDGLDPMFFFPFPGKNPIFSFLSPWKTSRVYNLIAVNQRGTG